MMQIKVHIVHFLNIRHVKLTIDYAFLSEEVLYFFFEAILFPD